MENSRMLIADMNQNAAQKCPNRVSVVQNLKVFLHETLINLRELIWDTIVFIIQTLQYA